jgi:hypothetical protein
VEQGHGQIGHKKPEVLPVEVTTRADKIDAALV